MRVTARAASAAIVLVWMVALLRPTGAAEPLKERLKPGHCPCAAGKSCWHYLRSPLKPPEDPCHCGLCRAKGNCSTMPKPENVSADCWNSQDLACFWKRHAGSWGITCQACAEDTTCSACDAFAHLPVSDSVKKTLEAQSHLEGDTPKRHVLVGWTSHFYVAV